MEVSGCKYENIDTSIINLINIYVTYVKNGNTQLIDLPYEIFEVGEIIERYKMKAETQKHQDEQEKNKQRELIASITGRK